MTQRFDISDIPISKRWSFIFAERGYLEVDGNAVVLRQGRDNLTHLPIGASACLMLEPGVVVTHEAVKACAEEQTLMIWVGEQGVRCYSAGLPGGACGERILEQAALRLDAAKRRQVAHALYRRMFKEEPPQNRSIDQLRGTEGTRVKKAYKELSKKYAVPWNGRNYDIADFDASDDINKAISVANVTLYSLAEAVILTLGYSPAIGFVHSGHPRSFAFDIADTIKVETTIDLAFRVIKESPEDVEGSVRRKCRDLFKEQRIAGKFASIIEEVLT
ncbi:MAG: type I-E CRISPR-associated endonuclease Cas1 [Gammaproteobacteria bacterium]|nr:type I-E CRISPR-associated endonuclease Cas1 [Gammaproteobacteria bacterium]